MRPFRTKSASPTRCPRRRGAPIVYPGAVLTGAKQPAAAQKFLDYLAGEPARRVFEKFGFRPAP
ncbi:MAG: substrate-binding domain-containing protein [Chthoniobacter sp.]